MKYVCEVCGYIYDDAEHDVPFAELPDSWVCPMCGAPKAVFAPVAEKEEEKKSVPAPQKAAGTAAKKYVCTVCGYIYDDAEQDVPFAELPESWTCPMCGAPKAVFEEVKENAPAEEKPAPVPEEEQEELTELNAGEMAALFSNLARGCEKQYQEEARKNFQIIADYFEALVPAQSDVTVEHLAGLVKADLDRNFVALRAEAEAVQDRGALRAVTWGEKVTRMTQSLLARYQKEGDAFLENTGLYVCTVCGFLYVGDNPPEICPVCKVPGWKFKKIEGRVRA